MTVLSQERFALHPAEKAKPKYERFKSFLLAELSAGRLKPGDSLPSEPKMADSLQIARSTIRQALGELERDGVVERIKGQGTFIRESEAPKVREGVDAFAFIVPETMGGTFYSPLISGFEEACHQVHNEMITRSTGNSPTRQADAILALLDKKVGGIAIVPATTKPTPPYQIRQLQEFGMPVVFCHRNVKGVSAPTLTIDFKQLGRMVGEQVLKHGHERIAYLSLATGGDQAKIGCEEGLQEVFHESGLKLNADFMYRPLPELKLPVANYAESVRKWLKEILSREDRPTAIFASYDPLAEMTLTLLWELGLRVPEDISIISAGPMWRETLMARKLSAVVFDSIQAGRKACELIIEMRSGQRALNNSECFEVPLALWEGETLGLPNNSSILRNY